MTNTEQERFSEQTFGATDAFIAAHRAERFRAHNSAFATFAATTAFALVVLTTPAPSLAAPSPLATYNFDAGAGVSLADQSGNDHPGTLVNGPVWAAGQYNGGLAFDGVNDYVSMGDVGQADGLAAITVSTWVKFAVNGGAPYETHFIDKSRCNGVSNGGPWELGASLFGTHKAEFVIYPQGGSPSAYIASGSSAKSIDDGAWHYVTGRYDGVSLSIWVDGNLENSKAVSGLTMSNTGSSLELGGNCNGASYPFKGTLDDVRIYARALTQSEILADMATAVDSGAPAPTDTTAPSTPTGLSTSGVTASQVTLSWQASTDNVGVAGYRVYRDGSLVGSPSSTTFTNTGLASNTSYAFTVAAFDAAGNSSPASAPRSVTTGSPPPVADTTAPSTPTGLSTSGVTASQVTLAWQASTDNVGVTGYRVYRDGSLVGTTSSTTFTDSGLASNTSYIFTVAAFDAAGNSSPSSAPRSVTTSAGSPPPPPADTTAPSTPTGLSSSNVTASQVTLAWQASTDNVGVTGYRVYRDGSLAGTASSTSFTNSGLAANTSYVFTVAAFDAAGNSSSQSAQRSVTTSAPPSSGGASPLAAYSFDAGSGVSLADQSGNNLPGTLVNGPVWTAGRYNGGLAFDGANDYVTMGDVGQADGLTAITVSAWVKFAANGGAPYETHLIDKSQCNGASGGGPWELGASLFGNHKAEFVIYPQGGSPSAYIASGSSAKSIDDGAWHYVTGRYDGVNLSIWVDGNLENSKAVSGLTMSNTGSSVELGGHCNGAAYPFKGTLDDVRIYARALTSSEILADMATPVAGTAQDPPPPVDTTAPSTPTGLSAPSVTTTQITLSWQASTDNVGVAGYRVYRNGVLAGTTSSTSFTNSGLSSNTSYVFTVIAFDAAGNNSSQSAPFTANTSASGSGSGYTTNFSLTENPISEGGRWINGRTNGIDWSDVSTTPGLAIGHQTGASYTDATALLTGTWAPDQSATATVYTVNQNDACYQEVELRLRSSISARSNKGYEIGFKMSQTAAAYLIIVRWNGPVGSFDYLYNATGSQFAIRNGDVVKAEIAGNVIKAYVNGVQKAQVDITSIGGTTYTSGSPGMGFNLENAPSGCSGTNGNYGFKNFTAN